MMKKSKKKRQREEEKGRMKTVGAGSNQEDGRKVLAGQSQKWKIPAGSCVGQLQVLDAGGTDHLLWKQQRKGLGKEGGRVQTG